MTPTDPTREWCAEAVGLLHDTATRAARLASAVATDWLDAGGQAWAARLDALRRDLDDAARQANDVALWATPPAAYGPRLGSTSGARVDDEHGVRIAQLPDPPP